MALISRISPRFEKCLDRLPQNIQRVAEEKFRLWKADPRHPSLRFKQVKPDLWAVRVSRNYRALGQRHGDHIDWFWIGPHDEYDRLLG